jgi:hypothetical protein
MQLPKGLVLGLIAVAALAFGVALVAMAFVFSIGTATVPLAVEATVRDRLTRQPVGGCLLAFETGPGGRPVAQSARAGGVGLLIGSLRQ